MTVYGEVYANQYDQLYGDKDYRAECDLIEQAFRHYGIGEVRSVVDFGCGTGNHSIHLAQRGYQVTGVDLSPEMLHVARKKSEEAGVSVNWVEGDICNVRVGGPFDAGLFMFSVLGYFGANEALMAAFDNARRHIRPSGILAFDVWYGPAVLSIKPSDRVKIIPTSGGRVIRMITSALDIRHHLVELHYHLWQLIGDHIEAECEELHLVRYFFPMELELILSESGFALTALTAFPTLERPADETTWNVFVVARAV